MHRKSILLVMLILALTFLACGGTDDGASSAGSDSSNASSESSESSSGFHFNISFGDTASIENIDLGQGYDPDNITTVESTDVFSTQDTEFHCVVKLASAPDGTKIKVVWTSLDSALGQNKQVFELEQEVKNSSYGPDFAFTANPGLPAGLHQVDIYLDNELNQSLEFTVEES